jgi:hypothetical protein
VDFDRSGLEIDAMATTRLVRSAARSFPFGCNAAVPSKQVEEKETISIAQKDCLRCRYCCVRRVVATECAISDGTKQSTATDTTSERWR